MKRYNAYKIRMRRSYSTEELSEAYDIHPRTVQDWHKQGLKAIDETSRPYLYIGEEIRRFLNEKNKIGKHPLKPGEFFCLKCHSPRKSLTDRLETRATKKTLGSGDQQVIINGICEVCGVRVFLFSSETKVKILFEQGILQLSKTTDTNITVKTLPQQINTKRKDY